MSDHTVEICLYGTSRTGAGFIACTKGGKMVGNGAPLHPNCTFTEAIFAAVEALREAGVTKGKVAIYASGGMSRAFATLENYCSTFGQLEWESAPSAVVIR